MLILIVRGDFKMKNSIKNLLIILLSLVFIVSFGLTAYNPKKWYKQWEEDTRLEFVEVIRRNQQRMAASEQEQKSQKKPK